MSRQVFPTLPSPTTTSLIAIGSYDIKLIIKVKNFQYLM